MRVLMLGWEFPPRISGGLGTACHGLTRGLARREVEVTFVVPRVQGDEDAGPARMVGAGAPAGARVVVLDSALLPYLSESDHRERMEDLPARAAYGAGLLEEVARYARAVESLAGRERFDVVHAHDWMTFEAGIAASRAARRPLVVHFHSTEHDRAGGFPDPRIVAAEQRGLEAADAVLCVSRYAAGVLSSRYRADPAKVRVVHNAPPPEVPPRRHGGPRRIAEPIVLFLGRVTSQKGPAFFLEAAARVVREEPRVKFVVAGTGDLLGEMVERAASLGLGRSAHFTGFLRGEELERAFGEATLLVMPSVSEPFGISPLEAAVRGVPAIVSRQSGVAEVLPSAVRVDYWNTEELAAKILDLLRRPALRRRIATRTREEARELRWETQAGLVREVYERVLEAPR